MNKQRYGMKLLKTARELLAGKNEGREELIQYYKKNLSKVKGAWGNDLFRGKDYVDFAKEQLRKSKAGELDHYISKKYKK